MSGEPKSRLLAAVERNDIDVVRAALDEGDDIDAPDKDGYTPLHRAIVREHVALIELLLDRGAQVNTQSRQSTPLVSAVSYTRARPFIRRLLDAGARVTANVLYWARDQPELHRMLEDWPIRGSERSALDQELLLAARAGNLDAVVARLGEGADPTACDREGVTAIQYTLRGNHDELGKLLERTAIHWHPSAALFRAILDDAAPDIRAAMPTDLEVRTAEGLTPLMLAARYHRLEALQTLLALGAVIDARNGHATALVYAIEAGDLDALLVLLDNGATVNYAVDGTHPVFAAVCLQTDSDLLKHLLLRGLDIASYPSLFARHADCDRMLRSAREGSPPVEPYPIFAAWTDCSACRDLPEHMYYCISANGSVEGDPLPAVTERFESLGDLWQCPWCGVFYQYVHDRDGSIIDGWNSESLRRLAHDRVLEILRGLAPTPRVLRAITALTSPVGTRPNRSGSFRRES